MKKEKTYFVFGLITAIWFLLTSFMWVYYLNLLISFPFGIMSLILWLKGRKLVPNSMQFKAIGIILALGLLSSLITLMLLLFRN